ncbi:snare associated Golgi protein-domain-containing protein [Melampsora americana]|nr:snare associated Golgi protein-domain-containing protein [Melampsora americana]
MNWSTTDHSNSHPIHHQPTQDFLNRTPSDSNQNQNGRFTHHHHQPSSPSYPPQHQSSNQTISELVDSFSSHSNHPLNLSKVKRQKSFRDKQWDSAFGPLSLNTFLRKDWIKYYIILLLLIIAVTVITIFHHQIIVSLKPFADDLHDLKIGNIEIGWIIPILILFIISFPPLFGHEIVIIICGLVWGLWIGFAIVSIGTFLGEVANYWTFKYACTKRAQKLESKDLNYACMCIVIRDGGFWIAFLARLSAIPSHLITPVFATTGMSLWIFSSATLLSMPKQLAGVYLGTLFNLESNTKSTSSKIIEYIVLIISFLVTVIAAMFIYKRMSKARPIVQARWESERAQQGLDGQIHHVDPYYGNGLISSEWQPIGNRSIEEDVRMGRSSEDDWSSLDERNLIQPSISSSPYHPHHHHHPHPHQEINDEMNEEIEPIIKYSHTPIQPAFCRKDHEPGGVMIPTHVSRSG